MNKIQGIGISAGITMVIAAVVQFYMANWSSGVRAAQWGGSGFITLIVGVFTIMLFLSPIFDPIESSDDD